MTKRVKLPKRVLLILCAAACVLAACFLIPGAVDPYDNRILENVTIAGIDVGGMTRSQAKKALQETKAALSGEDMVVQLPDAQLRIPAKESGAKLNVRKAVNAAFAYGRETEPTEEGCAIGLRDYLELDVEALRSLLESYARQHDTSCTEYTCTMEGEVPVLTEEGYTENAQCQTLVITMGTPGVVLDVETALGLVLEAYDTGVLQADVGTACQVSIPAKPDMEALYQAYYIAPVDSSLNMETCEYVPGSYGYGFDERNAGFLTTKARYGETVRIPMEVIEPEILGEEVYYRDVLGYYNSGHSSRPNIVNNLQLVCRFLDGVVIRPGEIFSYNDAIGERTVERGFMYGESFTGFTVSRSAGGGVCQGSSVLYVCVLEADLEVLERANHGMVVGYTPLGQDAAVSWGDIDFRFRNNTNFPIKITAKTENNLMQVQLLGTDEKDYYILLESTTGQDEDQVYARCYKRKYDKETGELISRELASHSAYRRTG